jgi:hypothetical protein
VASAVAIGACPAGCARDSLKGIAEDVNATGAFARPTNALHSDGTRAAALCAALLDLGTQANAAQLSKRDLEVGDLDAAPRRSLGSLKRLNVRSVGATRGGTRLRLENVQIAILPTFPRRLRTKETRGGLPQKMKTVINFLFHNMVGHLWTRSHCTKFP